MHHVLCRDAESPYMSSQAPAGKQQTLQEKAAKELKQRWWLWGSIAFTVLLLSSLFVFRGYLYDTATHGLPFLAGACPEHSLGCAPWARQRLPVSQLGRYRCPSPAVWVHTSCWPSAAGFTAPRNSLSCQTSQASARLQ